MVEESAEIKEYMGVLSLWYKSRRIFCGMLSILLLLWCADGRHNRMNGLRFESMADMPPRMREAYARQVFPKAPAQQAAAKYHNAPAERAGVRFDSQKEARRYDELMVMLRAGIISDLLQESYMTETGERIRAVRYTADFSYKFGGKLVVEDVKSKPTRTKEYLRNKKFMRSKFGIDIQEI